MTMKGTLLRTDGVDSRDIEPRIRLPSWMCKVMKEQKGNECEDLHSWVSLSQVLYHFTNEQSTNLRV